MFVCANIAIYLQNKCFYKKNSFNYTTNRFCRYLANDTGDSNNVHAGKHRARKKYISFKRLRI